jgi:hypothetical protein
VGDDGREGAYVERGMCRGRVRGVWGLRLGGPIIGSHPVGPCSSRAGVEVEAWGVTRGILVHVRGEG